ncbi:hypothetical protein GEMRC1_007697 [Eukaryota sp. GEM-RC1]
MVKAIGSEILLVSSIKKNGCYTDVVNSLKDNAIDFVEVDGVQPNPEIEVVRTAIQAYRDNQCDAILAVGGGSVIDSAKAVAAGVCYDGDVWDLFEQQLPFSTAAPLFVVLTLSGTGSEMNPNCVVSDSKAHKKYHIGGPPLFPIVSVVDPKYQSESLSWWQTVNGAIDAFIHLWEAYAMYIPSGKPITSIRYVEGLMLAVLDCLEALHVDQKDAGARADLCWATTLALNLSTTVSLKGGDWAVHFLEHAVGAVNPEVSHGAGLAVILPSYWKFLVEHRAEQLPMLLRLAKNVFGVETVEEMVEKWLALLTKYGHPTVLSDRLFDSVSDDLLEAIADAYHKREGFYGGFNITRDECLEILKDCK